MKKIRILHLSLFLLLKSSIALAAEAALGADAAPVPETALVPAAILVPAATVGAAVETSSEKPAQPSLKVEIKNLKWTGDFRYRHQAEKTENSAERRTHRIQLRLGLQAQLNEWAKLNIRLMTGTSNNSGNQTLGDTAGSTRRSVGVDHAYLNFFADDFFDFYLGKMPQSMKFAGKNQIILDRDIALEGAAFRLGYAPVLGSQIGLNAGSFWVKENYDSTYGEDQTDVFFNSAQIFWGYKLEKWSVKLTGGLHSFTALKDVAPASIVPGSTSRGNTLDVSGNYPANFDIQERSVELFYKPLKDWEINLFTAQQLNIDVEQLNKAYSKGFGVTWKSLSFNYLDQKIEKDAVLAAFTDSDFANGETSSEGTVVSLQYKIDSSLVVQLSQFKNKNSLDTFARDYSRTHLDLTASF